MYSPVAMTVRGGRIGSGSPPHQLAAVVAEQVGAGVLRQLVGQVVLRELLEGPAARAAADHRALPFVSWIRMQRSHVTPGGTYERATQVLGTAFADAPHRGFEPSPSRAICTLV
jgi:hypothetical protein